MMTHEGAQLITALAKARDAVQDVQDFVSARKAASECEHARAAYREIERRLGEVAGELGGEREQP